MLVTKTIQIRLEKNVFEKIEKLAKKVKKLKQKTMAEYYGSILIERAKSKK